jgi:hypothetical protein
MLPPLDHADHGFAERVVFVTGISLRVSKVRATVGASRIPFKRISRACRGARRPAGQSADSASRSAEPASALGSAPHNGGFFEEFALARSLQSTSARFAETDEAPT